MFDSEEIMIRSDHKRTVFITIATAVCLAWTPAAMAQDVASGERIWKAKAECPQCHG
jgi:hypothetical protein